MAINILLLLIHLEHLSGLNGNGEMFSCDSGMIQYKMVDLARDIKLEIKSMIVL